MSYITRAEAYANLGTSNEDSVVDVLIGVASTMIDNYCGISLAEWDYTENYDYKWLGPYYFKHYFIIDGEAHPTRPILEIEGVASTLEKDKDFQLKGRSIIFRQGTLLSYNTDFNTIKFKYKWWLADYTDVKNACYMIVAWLYKMYGSSGIGSFTQWDLTVSYKDKVMNDDIKLLLNKYKVVNVVS